MKRLSNNIGRRLSKIEKDLAQIPSAAHREFQSLTPIDTGNARRSTALRGTAIDANYPYAVRLNTGWSKQAPNGMTDDTIDFIRDQIRKM